VQALADSVRIHPAIAAGRNHREEQFPSHRPRGAKILLANLDGVACCSISVLRDVVRLAVLDRRSSKDYQTHDRMAAHLGNLRVYQTSYPPPDR
jgi:hypothetical protein